MEDNTHQLEDLSLRFMYLLLKQIIDGFKMKY
jgi:hypothetical protein